MDLTRPNLRRRRLPNFDYSSPDHAYFITVCARAGTSPFTDHRLADEVLAALHWLRGNRGVKIYAYCLMPDHLHLLLHLNSGGRTLGDIVGSMKKATTKRSWMLGHKGQLWQPRFHDHILRRSEHGARIASYILENPVRKGLVEEASNYQYSGFLDPM